jgi:hypothetical protein
MTYRDVYVGELGPDEALDWGGDPRIGNAPKRIGPFFHPIDKSPYELLHRAIDMNTLTGRQVDWGAVAARVTVDDIRAFVDECYGPDVPADIASFIASLDPTRPYALVASEL